jgi:ribose/xylose/arabinose/galactoside ABC-type transport system permease subunit
MAEPSSIARAARLQEAGLLLVVLLLGALIALSADTIVVRGQPANAFLRWDNLLANVATPMSWMAIMALGATAVIVSGGIDISVGSIFGLSALGTAAVLQHLPADAALPLSLGVAAGGRARHRPALRPAQRRARRRLRLHPFIVTLGTMSIFRGLANVSVETRRCPRWGASCPDSFTEGCVGWRWTSARGRGGLRAARADARHARLRVGFWLLLAHTVTGARSTRWGATRRPRATRGCASAPSSCASTRCRACARAGRPALGRLLPVGNTATGEGYELAVIAAAVVGGASLLGGRGTALGAVLGALVIKLIENGIDILRRVDLGLFTLSVSKEYGQIIIGVAILLAVAIDRLSERWRGTRG